LTDKFYIQKVIEGHAESFRFLIDRYKDKAFSVAYSVLRNKTIAEDAVQESFIKAFNKISTFRGDAAFSTWLMRIVVNESIKELRRRKMEIEGQKNIANIDELNINNSVKLLKEEEQKTFIEKTLKKMPQQEALTLQLFYIDEMNLKEIVDVMQIKLGHIKVLLFRGRKRFYGLLKTELKHELTDII